MTTVQETAEALRAAADGVADVRSYRDLAATIQPPAAVLGPPSLQWEGYVGGPTSARFLLYVVTQADARALEMLWELVPLVAAAVEDSVTDAVVTRADPGTFASGGSDLPCYELTIEVAL